MMIVRVYKNKVDTYSNCVVVEKITKVDNKYKYSNKLILSDKLKNCIIYETKTELKSIVSFMELFKKDNEYSNFALIDFKTTCVR